MRDGHSTALLCNPTKRCMQETHLGTSLPMSLLAPILETRQPAPARPDCARQRGDPRRLPRGHRPSEVPATAANGHGQTPGNAVESYYDRTPVRPGPWPPAQLALVGDY